MLHEFLSANRTELIARCRAKVSKRPAREANDSELEHGITMFLDQLITTLQLEQTSEPLDSRRVSGPSGGSAIPSSSEVGAAAARHGLELLNHGFSIEQVVHDYGDLCQALMEMALEADVTISADEYRTFNRCLDNAIADAVTGFNRRRDSQLAEQKSQEENQRLGFLAHELRNYLTTAITAVAVIKMGNVGLNGATGAVLDRSLIGIRNLIDRSLAEVRINAEPAPQRQLFSLAAFISEMQVTASLEAKTRGCTLFTSFVDARLAVNADRDLLFSSLGNLLQNAFKFTRPGTQVTLTVRATDLRILLEVEDCGPGLSPEQTEQMFLPWTQSNEDRSGLGLGLSIAKRSVEANAGTLRVRNKPDGGCGAIFTIDLPRHTVPDSAAQFDRLLG